MLINQYLNLIAVKYYFLNQNKSKLIFYIVFFRQRSFHETESIYDLIVSSYVERNPVAFPC